MSFKLHERQSKAHLHQQTSQTHVKTNDASKDDYRKCFENIKKAMDWSEKTYKQQLMIILHEYRKEHRFCCTPATVDMKSIFEYFVGKQKKAILTSKEQFCYYNTQTDLFPTVRYDRERVYNDLLKYSKNKPYSSRLYVDIETWLQDKSLFEFASRVLEEIDPTKLVLAQVSSTYDLEAKANLFRVYLSSCECLDEITTLKMNSHYNGVHRIPPEISLFTGLQELVIEDCNFVYLSPEIWELENLEVLTIKNSRVQIIPDIPYPKALSKLKTITIENCGPILYFTRDVFRLPALTKMHVSHVKEKNNTTTINFSVK
jgi:hypothetical protein